MFRTVPLTIIRSFSLYTQQWFMSYRFADSFASRIKNCPKHVEFYSKNKFDKLVHLVGFILRLPTLQLTVGAVQRPWLTAKGQWLANWIIQPVLIVTFSMHNFRHSIASTHKYWTLDHDMNQKLKIELSKERNRKHLFQRIFYLFTKHDVMWNEAFVQFSTKQLQSCHVISLWNSVASYWIYNLDPMTK